MPHILIKRNLSESVLGQIPILRQIRRLMEIIDETGGIKMTKVGNLPVKIVQELYPLGVPDRFVEWGFSRVYSEDKLECIQMMHFLAKACGAVRMYKGRLVLTKKGKGWLRQPRDLLCELIHQEVWCIDNGAMDGYKIGNINPGIAATLMLLYRYGDEPREAKFYAEEFAKVCPAIMDVREEPSYCDVPTYRSLCFSVRVIERGLSLFGVAERIEGKFNPETQKLNPDIIVKKPLFDEVFEYVEALPEELSPNDEAPVDTGSTVTLHSNEEALSLIFALSTLNRLKDKPLS